MNQLFIIGACMFLLGPISLVIQLLGLIILVLKFLSK